MLSLTLDLAIVLLLIIVLVSGYRLHKRLKIFRVDTKEFEPLILALDNAAKRAGAVLADLRQIAEDVSVKLNTEASNTQRLLDELDFMTKRADQIADKLDGMISGARKQEVRQQPAMAATDPHRPSETLASIPQEQRRRAPDLEKRLKTLR